MYAVQDFRDAFPDFGADLFPDSRVAFHLTLARKQLNPARWEDLLDNGYALFIAHYLTLEAEATRKKDGTGGFTAASGPVVGASESKTVGGVSKSVSENRAGPAATARSGAGQWNLTIYGQQFWDLVQIVGAGGTVV
jgi:hypothetical protein